MKSKHKNPKENTILYSGFVTVYYKYTPHGLSVDPVQSDENDPTEIMAGSQDEAESIWRAQWRKTVHLDAWSSDYEYSAILIIQTKDANGEIVEYDYKTVETASGTGENFSEKLHEIQNHFARLQSQWGSAPKDKKYPTVIHPDTDLEDEEAIDAAETVSIRIADHSANSNNNVDLSFVVRDDGRTDPTDDRWGGINKHVYGFEFDITDLSLEEAIDFIDKKVKKRFGKK